MADDVFGIDLGTTYSAIAYINDLGQAEVVLNREGDPTTPSVVFFENASNFVVGKEAKNGAIINRDTTVALIKRHMGTDLSMDFYGQTYKPETVSSLILKDLVDYARDATGSTTDKVVITVPAYFGLAEKEATRQAGAIAGLDVVGIVTEPVAAALSVGIKGDDVRTLFVYDLGGGTFDCTILEIGPDKVEVIVIDGNRRLGGADWDTRLFDLVAAKFAEQAGLSSDDDPTADEDFAQRLLTEVEDAKKTLSRRDKASLMLSYGEARERVEVTREEFEAATRSLVDETLEIVRRTVAAAEEKRPGIVLDEVLLVGGSSRMPMIEESLQSEMGWTLRKTELDLAVAKGAAIYGQGEPIAEAVAGGDPIDGEAPSGDKTLRIGGATVSITNVLSRAIGVMFVRDTPSGGQEDYIGFLAKANEPLPLEVAIEAGTAVEGQTAVQIRLYEQASETASEDVGNNREITPDGATLSDLPSLPKGSPVHFNMRINTEGAVQFSAFEPVTGQRIELDVRIAVMPEEEVEEAKRIVAGLSRRD